MCVCSSCNDWLPATATGCSARLPAQPQWGILSQTSASRSSHRWFRHPVATFELCLWLLLVVLSNYRAFEKLAHPTYGVMGIEYRPVDCYSKEPLKLVGGREGLGLWGS